MQFDKNGNTGGCQSTYTVIPPVVQDEAPSCPNVTFPQGPLDVEAMVHDGPMSQFGWIDQVGASVISGRHRQTEIDPLWQCTDIQVTPKNGTPPYTFTVCNFFGELNRFSLVGRSRRVSIPRGTLLSTT